MSFAIPSVSTVSLSTTEPCIFFLAASFVYCGSILYMSFGSTLTAERGRGAAAEGWLESRAAATGKASAAINMEATAGTSASRATFAEFAGEEKRRTCMTLLLSWDLRRIIPQASDGTDECLRA